MFKIELISDKFVFQDVIVYDNEPVFLIYGWGDDYVRFTDINDLNNYIEIGRDDLDKFAVFLAKSTTVFNINKKLNLRDFFMLFN